MRNGIAKYTPIILTRSRALCIAVISIQPVYNPSPASGAEMTLQIPSQYQPPERCHRHRLGRRSAAEFAPDAAHVGADRGDAYAEHG